MLASCGTDGQIVLASLDPSASNLGWRAHAAEVNQIRFNADHDMLASCSDDYTAKIWEIPPLLASSTVQQLGSDVEKLLVCTLTGHTQRVTRVMWSTTESQTVATSVVASSPLSCIQADHHPQMLFRLHRATVERQNRRMLTGH